ncbi:MAG: enoyl-CoA hydratase/isomerase family protein [Candidatus Acidiferrales bacterium]
MPYNSLLLKIQDEIATISLNRPEKRNAISSEMIGEIPRALQEVIASPARVAILTGEGKAFCAGMDLENLRAIASQSKEKHLEDATRMADMFYAVYSFPKPLIAAVNGAAIAGGTGIATLADFTLAVPEAKFGYTEVRIGFLPAVVSVFLKRQVGDKHARDLLLTGRIFDAREAHMLGLVNQVVEADELMEKARELATYLIALSPTSLLRTKRLLLRSQEAAIRIDLEEAIRESTEIRMTADFAEGLGSFLEKRNPVWRGE